MDNAPADRRSDGEHQARADAERRAIQCWSVLGQIADGVIITDPSGAVSYSNEAARRILGVKRVCRLGDPGQDPADVVQLLTLEGKPFPTDELPLARTVHSGQTVIDAEIRIRRPNGTEAIVQGSATPVVAEDGTPLGGVFSFRDVTAQREFEQHKNEFIASLSHWLRTPLTVVKGQAQYLERRLTQPEPPGPEAILERLVKVDEAATTLTTLISNLVDVTRVQRNNPAQPFSFPTPQPRRPGQELIAVGSIARAVVQELEPRCVAAVIADQARHLLGTAAGVWLADLPNQELQLLALRSDKEVSALTHSEIDQQPFSAPTFSAQAARTGQPVEVPDVVSQGPVLALGRHTATREGFRAAFSQPMWTRGRLVGVLTVTYALPHAFLPDERELIRALADLGAVAIDNARLYREAGEARQRATENAALLDSFQEAAPVGFGFVDRDLRYVRVNPTLAAMNGVTVENHLGRTVREVIPELAAVLEPKLRQVLANGEPVLNWEVTTRQIPNLPEDRYWLITCFPVRTPDQESIGIGAVIQDITERKRVELALRASEQSLARAQQIAHLGSWERDLTTGCLRWSEEVYRIFGVPPGAFGGTFDAFLSLVHPDDRAKVQLAVEGALSGKAPYSVDHRIARPDGSLRVVHERADVLRDPVGQPIRLVGSIQDVTELKALERERQDWMSIVTHDLRQPLTTILGYANLLARQLARHGTPDQNKAITYILTSTQNLNRMIGDLLDVSRIEMRHLTVDTRPTDLPSLLRGVVERAAATIQGHSVLLEIHGPIPPVKVDPARIEQVVGNLLSNAVRYGYARSPIRVAVKRRNKLVEVTVTNHGEGIPPDEVPRLFSRFHRSRRAAETQMTGLGLGLYISKGLIEAHGGQIWVDSVPGKLTSFRFTLPGSLDV